MSVEKGTTGIKRRKGERERGERKEEREEEEERGGERVRARMRGEGWKKRRRGRGRREGGREEGGEGEEGGGDERREGESEEERIPISIIFTDVSALAGSLVCVFESSGKTLRLLKWAIRTEIAQKAHLSTVFREDDLNSKIIRYYWLWWLYC